MTGVDTAPGQQATAAPAGPTFENLLIWVNRPEKRGAVLSTGITLPASDSYLRDVVADPMGYPRFLEAFREDAHAHPEWFGGEPRPGESEGEIAERVRYWMNHPLNAGRSPGSHALPYNSAQTEAVIRQRFTGERRGTNWARTIEEFDRDDIEKPWLTHSGMEAPKPKLDPDDAITVNDPRVRHLWIQSAYTADEHNWCPTYDTIAEQSGVPTRQELKRAGELKLRTTVIWQYRWTQRIEGRIDQYEVERQRTENPAEWRAQFMEAIAQMDDETFVGAFDFYDIRVR